MDYQDDLKILGSSSTIIIIGQDYLDICLIAFDNSLFTFEFIIEMQRCDRAIFPYPLYRGWTESGFPQ